MSAVFPEEAYMDDPEDSGERRVDTKWLMRKYVEVAQSNLELERERDKARNRTKQIAIISALAAVIIGLIFAPDDIKALIPFLGKLIL